MRRLEFDAKLREILGSSNVYYNPPPNLQMKFPAIIYRLEDVGFVHADNVPYLHHPAWLVTYVTKNPEPDNSVVSALLDFKMGSFRRQYVSDGFYHFQFMIYY